MDTGGARPVGSDACLRRDRQRRINGPHIPADDIVGPRLPAGPRIDDAHCLAGVQI